MFNDARTRAIENLSDQSDMEIIDRILFAREYKVGSWLVEAYNALAQRHEPMSLNDGASLGWDVVFSMCIVRDQFDTSGRRGTCYRNNYDFRSVIKGTFQDELADVAVLDEHPVVWSHIVVKGEHEVKQDDAYYLESVVFRVSPFPPTCKIGYPTMSPGTRSCFQGSTSLSRKRIRNLWVHLFGTYRNQGRSQR